MATMNSIIEELDELKPNVFSDDAKYKWMARLDGLISLEIHQDENPVEYEIPKDADKPLLLGAPFEDVYVLYCAAMVDFHNREYNNYNQSVLMFTERLEQYKMWYIKNHAPASARNFRNVMG